MCAIGVQRREDMVLGGFLKGRVSIDREKQKAGEGGKVGKIKI